MYCPLKNYFRFLILMIASGCVSNQVDVGTDFRFMGRVHDLNGIGIPNIEVIFLDISLDQHASQFTQDFVVGITDDQGRINNAHHYVWGYRSNHDNSSELFDLIFIDDGREEYRIPYNLKKLECVNGSCLVEFIVELDIAASTSAPP